MIKRVAFDTMTLVRCVEHVGQPAVVEDADAAHLIASLKRQRTEILVPSIVAAEFLHPYLGTPRYAEAIRRLERIWAPIPFDLPSAALYAEIWKEMRPTIRTQCDGSCGKSVTREAFKMDAQILAAAIAHGAAILFTDDDWLLNTVAKAKAVENRIMISKIPPAPPQRANGDAPSAPPALPLG